MSYVESSDGNYSMPELMTSAELRAEELSRQHVTLLEPAPPSFASFVNTGEYGGNARATRRLPLPSAFRYV